MMIHEFLHPFPQNPTCQIQGSHSQQGSQGKECPRQSAEQNHREAPGRHRVIQRWQRIVKGQETGQKMAQDIVEQVEFETRPEQQQGVGPRTPKKHGTESKQ